MRRVSHAPRPAPATSRPTTGATRAPNFWRRTKFTTRISSNSNWSAFLRFSSSLSEILPQHSGKNHEVVPVKTRKTLGNHWKPCQRQLFYQNLLPTTGCGPTKMQTTFIHLLVLQAILSLSQPTLGNNNAPTNLEEYGLANSSITQRGPNIDLLTMALPPPPQPPQSSSQQTQTTFCIPTPPNLAFCSIDLGWTPTMRLPNLMGQRSPNELADAITMTSINEMINVRCKASNQLKLLLCTTMSPICLDTIIQPCRHLCIIAKSSCRAALLRQGIEWPKFLDCRRFPRGQDNCIMRQPELVANEPLVQNQNLTRPSTTRQPTKRRRKGKKESKIKTTTTTASPTTITTISTTTSPATTLAATIEMQTLEPMTASATPLDVIQTTSTPLTTTTMVLEMSSTAVPAQTSSTTQETTTTTKERTAISKQLDAEQVITDISQIDYSSMPINVTDDLTQLLCSTSPDWLIKTKLTDNQLMAAVRRRKLKIRSYRSIFGSVAAASNRDSNGNNTTSTINGRTSSKTSPLSLNLSLSESTVFVTAMGSTLYTQPLTNALSKAGEHQTHAELRSPGRIYLISGTSSSNTSKLASVFVVWPSTKITNEADSRGNFEIVKTYRNFKLRGLSVCQHQGAWHSTKMPSVSQFPTAQGDISRPHERLVTN